jgi:hypothetical protein
MDSEGTLILYYLRKLYFDCTCWAVKVGTWSTVMLAALVMLTQAVFLTISSTVYINRSLIFALLRLQIDIKNLNRENPIKSQILK